MGQRPPDVIPPPYLSPNPPVPVPDALGTIPTPADDPDDRNPVRYGDWELKGMAIDF